MTSGAMRWPPWENNRNNTVALTSHDSWLESIASDGFCEGFPEIPKTKQKQHVSASLHLYLPPKKNT